MIPASAQATIRSGQSAGRCFGSGTPRCSDSRRESDEPPGRPRPPSRSSLLMLRSFPPGHCPRVRRTSSASRRALVKGIGPVQDQGDGQRGRPVPPWPPPPPSVLPQQAGERRAPRQTPFPVFQTIVDPPPGAVRSTGHRAGRHVRPPPGRLAIGIGPAEDLLDGQHASPARHLRATMLHQHPPQGRPARQSPTTLGQRDVDLAPGHAGDTGDRPGVVLGPEACRRVVRISPVQNPFDGQQSPVRRSLRRHQTARFGPGLRVPGAHLRRHPAVLVEQLSERLTPRQASRAADQRHVDCMPGLEEARPTNTSRSTRRPVAGRPVVRIGPRQDLDYREPGRWAGSPAGGACGNSLKNVVMVLPVRVYPKRGPSCIDPREQFSSNSFARDMPAGRPRRPLLKATLMLTHFSPGAPLTAPNGRSAIGRWRRVRFAPGQDLFDRQTRTGPDQGRVDRAAQERCQARPTGKSTAALRQGLVNRARNLPPATPSTGPEVAEGQSPWTWRCARPAPDRFHLNSFAIELPFASNRSAQPSLASLRSCHQSMGSREPRKSMRAPRRSASRRVNEEPPGSPRSPRRMPRSIRSHDSSGASATARGAGTGQRPFAV